MLAPKVTLRRLRFWWRLASAYLLKYKIWIVSAVVLIIILYFGLTKLWTQIVRSNTVTVGYVGVYSLQHIPTQVLSLATQSLIATDSSAKPIPSLASHWTVSDDGKTYVVFLKDNLKWHDSTDVTARDIAVAIENVTITALNNKAIEFKLPNPISSFPLALDKPVFKANSFYGMGEFRIVGIDKVGDIVKKITLIPKDNQLPKVEIKFYQTADQAKNAIKLGEIKSATVANAQEIQSWPNLNVKKTIDPFEEITIFFNNEDSQLISKELRLALTYAINRTDFDGQIALGPIAPTSWAFNSSIKKYEYNSAKAKELLSKSKVENPHITLSVTKDLEEIAEKVKENWDAIGVKTDIKVEKTLPKSFQALLAVNQLKPDPDQYSLWHSTQKTTNITRYKNVKIDKLLEDARTTQDENTRRDLYSDFQRFLVEDSPAIFLYHPYKYHVTYKNVQSLIEKINLQF